jgi:hypothetical protein
MKILIIILFPFLLTGQTFDKYDFLHHYAGVAITTISGSFIYYKTHNDKLSVGSGFALGILAGQAKEEIWDLRWKKGTYSNFDKFSTAWGSMCGSFYLVIGINLHQKQCIKNKKNRYTFNK